MVIDGAVNAPTLIRFLQRLVRGARRKVFLILDRLKAHRARLTQDWLAEHRAEIEVSYLPSYSPELNPDEGVRADLKQAVPRKAPAASRSSNGRPSATCAASRSGSVPSSATGSSAMPPDSRSHKPDQ